MIWIAAFAGFLCGVLVCYASEIVPRWSGGLEGELPPPPALLDLFKPRALKTEARIRLHWLVIAACTIGFGLLFLRVGWTLSFASTSALFLFFVLIALIDVKYRLVPNLLTYPAFIVVLGVHVVVLHTDPRTLLLGIGMAFGIFALTAALRRGEVGGGDIKLATLLGAIFGFR
ncbi:MAG: A24 family peptidase [Anaerolineae bacterium]